MKPLAIALVAAMVFISCQSEPVSENTTTSLPATTSTQSPTSTTTTTTTAIPETESAIYLFFEGYPVAPGPYLVAVSKEGVEGLEDTLAALLAGVTVDEAAMGLSSTIPEGTELLGVEVTDGVANVNLSGEFESGGGSLSMMGRVAQIVYTATRFDDVDSVQFLLEGTPLDTLGGEGLIIDQPQNRAAWTDMLSPILIETPSWGSTVGNDIAISGSARLESGSVSAVIVDADGLIIYESDIETTDPGQRSEFTTNVTVEVIPNPGTGSIIVWEWAPDGSQQHVLEYPLNLVVDD